MLAGLLSISRIPHLLGPGQNLVLRVPGGSLPADVTHHTTYQQNILGTKIRHAPHDAANEAVLGGQV